MLLRVGNTIAERRPVRSKVMGSSVNIAVGADNVCEASYSRRHVVKYWVDCGDSDIPYARAWIDGRTESY